MKNPNQLRLPFDTHEPNSPGLKQKGERYKRVAIPLEAGERGKHDFARDVPTLPARWEAAKIEAEKKDVLPAVLSQIRPVEALNFIQHLIYLSTDEGIVWVVYGDSGSGKSTFFNTLEYQTNNAVRTLILNGNDLNLTNQREFSNLLTRKISKHHEKHGVIAPLVIVLEQRESSMSDAERSTIAQALRNVLRPPGVGRNVIFVLPVTNSNQGMLFMEQVKATGVATPRGHNALYTFHGPPHTEHVNILTELFETLNDKDIAEFGIERNTLQSHVSSQSTIGEYIRIVRDELAKAHTNANRIIREHAYKPITVIVCFVKPLPAHHMEPIVKAMTLGAHGKIRSGEILRVTNSQKAQKWQNKRQALSAIVSTLDMRVVEFPAHLVANLVYAYGRNSGEQDHTLLAWVKRKLAEKDMEFKTSKNMRHNLKQRLESSNLFRIISGSETQSYPTPRYSNKAAAEEQERINTAVTSLVCGQADRFQDALHTFIAEALDKVIRDNSKVSSISDYRTTYAEPELTVQHLSTTRKVLRPDVLLEFQDRLVLLEFVWRSSEHFRYSDIATYILKKIDSSYSNLPIVSALTTI